MSQKSTVQNQTNQMQAYGSNSPVVSSSKLTTKKLTLPNFDTLMEISRLSDQIKFQTLKLEQKQLLLIKTKDEYRQKLLSDEKGIRSRVVTLKKRQNIAEVVEKIRQSEIDLHTKLQTRINQYQPTHRLSKNQKHNLLLALINKVTNAE
jgi:hypothetical protein